MVGVVILNWNGYRDTIACIHSLLQSTYKEFKIYLLDNRSTNESVAKIIAYMDGLDTSSRICFMPQKVNWGFAKGSNIGIRKALEDKCDYIWLLNNDTIVESDTLEKLINALQSEDNLFVVTPLIACYDNKNIIWNCGGIIFSLGFRMYYFAGKHISLCKKDNFRITFVTNCASLFKSEYFQKYGLLSERFFFGEEDFEMCLRNKKNNIKMKCIPSARIYHKVNSSIGKEVEYSEKMQRKDFLYYLNRFVNMRLYFNNSLKFCLFSLFYTGYIRYLLKKKGMKKNFRNEFISNLRKMSLKVDTVDMDLFRKIMDMK